MQGIFRKENTDKALKYGIYRHLPTYEKIIRNLVSFSFKNEEFKYEATEGMGFLVADRFYDENVEDINIFEGHYYYDKDSVTLQMEKVYDEKYKYLQGKEYKFVLHK